MAYPLLLYFVFGPSVVGAALFRNTIRLRVRSFCIYYPRKPNSDYPYSIARMTYFIIHRFQ